MKAFDDYIAAHDRLCEKFGYKHDWHVFPFEDRRTMTWATDGRVVACADSGEEFDAQDGHFYVHGIYTYAHLEKHMWVADGFTMLLVDTQVDGNIFLMIFTNELRRDMPEIL